MHANIYTMTFTIIERNCIALTSGTVSFSSSLLMVAMIVKRGSRITNNEHQQGGGVVVAGPARQEWAAGGGGLSTSYRRIIFSLSISDAIHSLAIVLGLFLVPREDSFSSSAAAAVDDGLLTPSWAIGNVFTCDLQGFVSTFGATTTCMNSFFLCIYYYCRIKKNMNGDTFAKKIEMKLHWFIILFNLTVCSVAAATKTFNPVYVVGSCQIMRYPYGCDPTVPGSCERGQYAKLFTLYYFPVMIPCLCIFGTILIMISIVVHVVKRDRLFRPVEDRNAGEEIEESEADVLARLLRREVTLQLILYVLAFLLTYGWVVLLALLTRADIPKPLFLSVIIAIFYPMTGLFNILIYTRPQVVAYKRLHSDISWHVAYWHVLKAGGENPSSQTSRSSSTCCRGGRFWSFFSFGRRKQKNRIMSSTRGILHLRALYEQRDFPPLDILSQQHVHEPCSVEMHSLEQRISTESNAVQYEGGERCIEVMADSNVSELEVSKTGTTPQTNIDINKFAHEKNIKPDMTFLTAQRNIISKAFEKASQRARLMDVRKGTKREEDHLRGLEKESNSQWSNGASQGGSFTGSFLDTNEPGDNIETDNDCEDLVEKNV
jgi:hypothetical protein